ncbi:MAG: nucleoside/nucleotide kinase family protein [Actinomycetota bacterium]
MPSVARDLVARARALIRLGERRILGIAGAPGAGKSALAEALVAALAPNAVLVPMDGFHLAQPELTRLGRDQRKGAPDTFDVAGYLALLQRLRTNEEAVSYAPQFRREIEEPVAGAIPVPRDTPLVITEGNYLLLDTGCWSAVRPMLDEAWFVEVPDEVRWRRLVARRVGYGQDREAAQRWARGSDQRNAELVASSRTRAELVIRADG